MINLMEQMKVYPPSYWDTLPTDDFHCIILPTKGKGGLYIGNIYAANNLEKQIHYNINSILTVTMKSGVKFTESEQIIFHKILPINIEEPGDLFKAFYDSYMFIENGLPMGNTLMHCIDCITLSPVFAMAYLLYKYNTTVERAWDLVKIQDPFAYVPHEFFTQLLRLEQSLNLDVYLGPKKQIYLTEYQEPKLSPLEKIKLRDEQRQNYIKQCYSQYKVNSNEPIDYVELKKRYKLDQQASNIQSEYSFRKPTLNKESLLTKMHIQDQKLYSQYPYYPTTM